MENLSLDQIKVLAQQTASPSISIFLPTHRAGQATRQDPIRFKNLLQTAEQKLLFSGMGPRDVRAVLKPGQALLNDTDFWQHQLDGLAIFMASDDFHAYHLPFRVEESLVIARSYYVKPILPLFTHNEHYYILTISQAKISLLEGTRYSVSQIDLPDGTPTSLDEALQFDDPEKQLQFHSGTSPGGIRAGMFHGQGAGDDEHKDRIERYLHMVDAALKEIFREQQAPLVLAGVDYLLSIYRNVSEYPHIMPEGITGSPEHLRPEELQARAWPIIEAHYAQEMQKVIEQYRQFAVTDKATDDLEAVVAAAFYGRVDKLFLAIDTQVWGKFNPKTGKVVHYQVEQNQEDDLALLDFAAMQTLQNNGTVYALSQADMPTKSSIAAVLRY